METSQHKTVNRAATVQPAAALKTVQRQALAATTPVRVPSFAKVSSPHDPAEQEAEATAQKIMRLAVPESSGAYMKTGRGGMFRQVKPEEKEKKPQLKLQSPYLTRFAAAGIFPKQKDEDEKIHRKVEELPKEQERIHRKPEGQPDVSANVAAEIETSLAAGKPLPLSVRRFMEPRFQADFGKVKIHTGKKAASLNRQFSAQAFTVGNQIFFGKDKFKPDTPEGQELIAHELTHTIQQGAVVQRRALNVTQQSPPMVQRLGISDILDYIAEKAYNIPGYRMFTIVLGVNPINMEHVDRSAANILRAAVEFMPFGHKITQALDKYGVFEKAGKWIEQQIDALGMVGKAFYDSLMAFLDSLGWGDLSHPIRTVERAIKIFTDPIDKLIAFAKGIFNGIITLIKEAILRPLAALAKGRFPGWYDLLKAILGEDPVTGEKVAPTPDLVIGSFMKLIGQEEVWLNLKKAKAVARAWAWFKGVLSSLLKFVKQIPSLFITALKSLTIEDIILLPRALAKVASVFGNFIGDFIKWGLNAVLNLLEIIFAVVAPKAVPYLKKTGKAFTTIIKHPIAFVGHLVHAGKLGFQKFSSKFGMYLKKSLLEWLTGTLGPSVYIPKSFEIREIIKFVLSVLGLTWQNIRAKLVKVVGETTVKIMETEFDIVVTLVTQGPAAAWDKIYAQLANLQELVMGEITKYVTVTVVQNAIAKLLTMLTPAGAFIQAIIAIYNTIMFFVERLRQIIQVVTAFLDSLAAIAAGVIVAAAKRVESTLAGLLTLVISFLARFAGLGKLSDAVTNIINKIRAPIDLALDKVVGWIVTTAKSSFKKLMGKDKDKDKETPESQDVKARVAGDLRGKVIDGRAAEEALLQAMYAKYRPLGLKDIEFERDRDNPEIIDVFVSASLKKKVVSMPKSKQLVKIGIDMLFNNPRTSIYAFIEGNKPFPPDGKPIQSQSSRDPSHKKHAEAKFKQKVPQLLERIKKLQKDKKISQGEVPVTLEMNRTPCDEKCVPLLEKIGDELRGKVRLIIKPTSVWEQKGGLWHPELSTAEGLVRLMKAGIEVKPSDVWDVLFKLILEQGRADELRVKGQWYRVNETDLRAARSNFEDMLNQATGKFNKLQAVDKPAKLP